MNICVESEFSNYKVGKPGAHISGGPDRVVTNEPDPEFKRKRVGFVIQEEE